MGNVSLVNGHVDGADTCVICGRDIPEGSQYCIICGMKKPRKGVFSMTVKERENIQRATGIVEGVALSVDKTISDALFAAISILQELLEKGDNTNA